MPVHILLTGGTKVLVPSEAFGAYAVHRQYGLGGVVQLRGWAVTHAASGVLVWKVKRRLDAIEIARHLHQKQVFPADIDRDRLYTMVEDPLFVRTLSRELTQIAERWNGLDPPDDDESDD